ncbi:hypothetical protein ACO1O0_005877 [Amphichorda felina]
MNPAAATPSEDQLIAQTRRLSLEASGTPFHQPTSTTPAPSRADGHQDGRILSSADGVAAGARLANSEEDVEASGLNGDNQWHPAACPKCLDELPTEVLFHILEFLDINDLLSTSRTSHHLRNVSLTPLLHVYRLRRTRRLLPPLLYSPTRPSLADLIARSIFLTKTTVVSRRLGRSLVSIRLARRLAARPSVEALVERAVLPKECVPGMAPVHVAPTIVQRKKAVERERVKDTLRRWIEGKWRGEVREREESQRRWEESRGVGRVWRLRRFWERIGKGEGEVAV